GCRERKSIGTGLGHRARASRRALRGLGRQSPNPCWVQPPMGLTPAARSPLQSVRAIRPPPAATTPLLNSTKAVDGILFSLDYGTFIRVRLLVNRPSTPLPIGPNTALTLRPRHAVQCPTPPRKSA